MKAHKTHFGKFGLQPWTLALRHDLTHEGTQLCHEFERAGASVEIRQGQDTLWTLVYGPAGGFAFRLASSPGGVEVKVSQSSKPSTQSLILLNMTSVMGQFNIQVCAPHPNKPILRWTVTLKPADDVRIPFAPNDVYPLDGHGNPANTEGLVHAGQRGVNTALLYASLTKPRFGSLLYVQNLTALNDYFLTTETLPDGCVGGEWPELGYQPPDAAKPLPKGKEITISDVFVHWSQAVPETASQTGQLFLELLAGIYEHLERPEAEYHDWPMRAEETLRDLKGSRKATIKQYGHRYVRPYASAELPDSMVQLAVLWPLYAYETWQGKSIALAKALSAGMQRFYDPKLKTLRRYLPNAKQNPEKNEDQVDSWYLYHPLGSLGRLAIEGHADARTLFLDSVDYAIKAGQHFKYRWPVQFNLKTFEVIIGQRKQNEPGQSDVGGLYAFVMLQAFELTHEPRFLQEAQKSVEVLIQERERFDLMYQANVTAWSATACLWLSKVTGKTRYLEQSYMFLASFFHNTLIWQSKLGVATNYPTFMGVTCLHDASYMAIYEEFESFVAFHEYLARGQSEIPEAVRMLLAEYCKYVLSRAWYYYPQELPKSALATEIRNGEIDQKLAFPLEDLYGDGQPAGQVGQEIYGCGAAFKFAAYAYQRLDTAPFLLFCDYPIADLLQPTDEPCVQFRVGGARLACRVRLIPLSSKPLPQVRVQMGSGAALQTSTHRTKQDNAIEFEVPADSEVRIEWK